MFLSTAREAHLGRRRIEDAPFISTRTRADRWQRMEITYENCVQNGRWMDDFCAFSRHDLSDYRYVGGFVVVLWWLGGGLVIRGDDVLLCNNSHPATQPPSHPSTQPPNHSTTQPTNHPTSQATQTTQTTQTIQTTQAISPNSLNSP